jgi:hypothetical protein
MTGFRLSLKLMGYLRHQELRLLKSDGATYSGQPFKAAIQ